MFLISDNKRFHSLSLILLTHRYIKQASCKALNSLSGMIYQDLNKQWLRMAFIGRKCYNSNYLFWQTIRLSSTDVLVALTILYYSKYGWICVLYSDNRTCRGEYVLFVKLYSNAFHYILLNKQNNKNIVDQHCTCFTKHS